MTTMKNQHFHPNAITAFFWENEESEKNNQKVKHEITKMNLNNFLNDLLINDVSIDNYIKKITMRKVMYSNLIFEETEKALNIQKIEDDFLILSRNLSKKQNENENFILNYICDDKEYEKIIKFFCLQYTRNPGRYFEYLERSIIRTGKNNLLNNENVIDFIDKDLLLDMNEIIKIEFKKSLNRFYGYSFKIFENKDYDNILIDKTIISLNEGDYFEKLYREQFSGVSSVFNDTYILTINCRFSLLFYPHEIESIIDNLFDIYSNNRLLINILNSREMIFKHTSMDKIVKEIIEKISYFKINSFSKYIENNNVIQKIEDRLAVIKNEPKKQNEINNITLPEGVIYISRGCSDEFIKNFKNLYIHNIEYISKKIDVSILDMIIFTYGKDHYIKAINEIDRGFPITKEIIPSDGGIGMTLALRKENQIKCCIVFNLEYFMFEGNYISEETLLIIAHELAHVEIMSKLNQYEKDICFPKEFDSFIDSYKYEVSKTAIEEFIACKKSNLIYESEILFKAFEDNILLLLGEIEEMKISIVENLKKIKNYDNYEELKYSLFERIFNMYKSIIFNFSYYSGSKKESVDFNINIKNNDFFVYFEELFSHLNSVYQDYPNFKKFHFEKFSEILEKMLISELIIFTHL